MNSGSASRVIDVTRPGTVISCQKISGCLKITAARVVVRDVDIACTSGRQGEAANATGVIFIDNGASATVERVAINGMSGVHACIWYQGTTMDVRGVNCRGSDDGIFTWADTRYSSTSGDNFTIADSYFHSFTVKTSNGHVDGFQTEGAAHGLIQHNTYLMTTDNGNRADSAIAIWNELKNSRDITVRNNLIAGGGFSIYAEDYSPSEASPSGGYTVTDIRFVDNVFSTHLFGCVGFYGVWFPRGSPSDHWNRSGNRVLSSGANVDGGNPTYQGRTCT